MSVSSLAALYFSIASVIFTPSIHQSTKSQIDTYIDCARTKLYRSLQVKQLYELSDDDYKWLAYNIYFEARNQELLGQLGVAMVTINRALYDRYWPNTIKEVVTQPHQFSWYNKRRVPPIKNEKAWKRAQAVARLAVELYKNYANSQGFDEEGLTRGSLYYFADYIKPPSWAKKLQRTVKIGNHIFYRDTKKSS